MPQVRTDCYGVTLAARAGSAAATSPRRPAARIWREIAELVANDFSQLRRNVVWIPAHTSAESIDSRRRSDGRRLTTSEWRANQLADALAKMAAPRTALRDEAAAKIRVAGKALVHAAAQLGVVTHAANNHKVSEVGRDGELRVVTKRDSTTVRRARPVDTPAKMAAAAAEPTATVYNVPHGQQQQQQQQLRQPQQQRYAAQASQPGDGPSRRRLKALSVQVHRNAAEEAEALTLQRLIAATASSAKPQAIPAQVRLAALRARIAEREGSACRMNAPTTPAKKEHRLTAGTAEQEVPR